MVKCENVKVQMVKCRKYQANDSGRIQSENPSFECNTRKLIFAMFYYPVNRIQESERRARWLTRTNKLNWKISLGNGAICEELFKRMKVIVLVCALFHSIFRLSFSFL